MGVKDHLGVVDHVASSSFAFAAVTAGSVVTWGLARHGGTTEPVGGQLSDGVKQVVGNNFAFAAIKDHGSVVTWGNSRCGGNADQVAEELASGVDEVVAGNCA